MTELIGLAHRVVLYLSAMTPGVAEEIDLLVRLGAKARTLVVVADPEGAGGASTLFEDVSMFHRAVAPQTGWCLPRIRGSTTSRTCSPRNDSMGRRAVVSRVEFSG